MDMYETSIHPHFEHVVNCHLTALGVRVTQYPLSNKDVERGSRKGVCVCAGLWD